MELHNLWLAWSNTGILLLKEGHKVIILAIYQKLGQGHAGFGVGQDIWNKAFKVYILTIQPTKMTGNSGKSDIVHTAKTNINNKILQK